MTRAEYDASIGDPIPPKGCRIFNAGIPPYGRVFYEGRTQPAHRIMWQIYFGQIPKGLCVCHKCNVKSCVNIEHLYLDTIRGNTRAAVRDGLMLPMFGDKNGSRKHKERMARGDNHYSRLKPELVKRGENHCRAKITVEMVLEIRERRKNGEKLRVLAKEYGLDETSISRIYRRKDWKHV